MTVPGSSNVVMLCDWLPPDFGAVGQYALSFAHELAAQGNHVTLVGFSSERTSESQEQIGQGRLVIRRINRPVYDRAQLIRRAYWTLSANLALVWAAGRDFRKADEVRFTGSPPYLLHFVMPLAKLLRIRTRYRITDFHPECLMAAMKSSPAWLELISWLTNVWRRRVDIIEVLGEDQRRRLEDCGVRPERIVLKRDPSPVVIDANTVMEPPPPGVGSGKVILYSGNWGVAHDHETFVQGFAQFMRGHPNAAFLWLNATGARAGQVATALASFALPFVKTDPVSLDRLPGVLRAADLHLITLDDRFVGYVMPSKVYACIASGRPILFVGSPGSDVHLLCSQALSDNYYRRVDVGDISGVSAALESLLGRVEHQEAIGTKDNGVAQ